MISWCRRRSGAAQNRRVRGICFGIYAYLRESGVVEVHQSGVRNEARASNIFRVGEREGEREKERGGGGIR